MTITDRTHPLYGRTFATVGDVSPESSSGSVTIILPDGQHRLVPREATDIARTTTQDGPVYDLPLVSVRTILPIVRFVRNTRVLRGEGNNDSRNAKEPEEGSREGTAFTSSTSESMAAAEQRYPETAGAQLGKPDRAHEGTGERGDAR